MKTRLTLQQGSFYFLDSINLLKGQTQEVDVSTLTRSERQGLKNNIRSGLIKSDVDVAELFPEAPEGVKEPEAPVTPKEVEEAPKEAPEAPQAEDKDTPKEDRSKWDKNRLKRELNSRKINYKSNATVEDLNALLEEDDKK